MISLDASPLSDKSLQIPVNFCGLSFHSVSFAEEKFLILIKSNPGHAFVTVSENSSLDPK